jgi:HAD superfamily phosphoserine phosphatase-like hydrolase
LPFSKRHLNSKKREVPPPVSVYFFDLDHTLITGNCSALFGAYLYAKGKLGFPTAALLLLYYRLHKWKWLSLEKLHHRSFKLLFSGRNKSEFTALLQEQVRNDFAGKKCPHMSAILEEARRSGPVYVVSASPDLIVKEYAKLFGADGYCATEYVADANGVFTHVGVIVNGQEKWDFAKERIQGLTSYAYSDDISDMPLLDNVTHGILWK